jgi:putative nucleotidyltransferase with HDIG domain
MTDSKAPLARILQQLSSALRSCALYPPGHPAIHTPLRHLASELATLLNERDRIILGIVDDVLVLDEIPFYDADTKFRGVFAALLEREVESITFQPGVTLTELEGLLQILAPGGPLAERSVPDAAKDFDLPHISFREQLDDDDPRERARATYHRSLGVVVDLMSEIRLGRIPSSEGATETIDTMRDLILTDESALLGLTLLKSYDDYTYNHSVNVAIFSLAFAKHLGIEGTALRRVGLAGLLHDVGKVRTAESIIKKPGALTDEEHRIMQLHPVLSAEIVEAMRGIDSETQEIVLHHHLRFDGGGYPELPQGREPHPHGTVVAIADCYDALTTTRPYQKSRHPSEAVRIMRRLSGKAYAPDIVSNFVRMIGSYPVGELVRLSTNELAVVMALNHIDATSPKLRIVTDSTGHMLPQPLECDLAREPDGRRLIVASVDPLKKGIDVAGLMGL